MTKANQDDTRRTSFAYECHPRVNEPRVVSRREHRRERDERAIRVLWVVSLDPSPDSGEPNPERTERWNSSINDTQSLLTILFVKDYPTLE